LYFRDLRELYIGHNEIPAVPKEISLLSKLEILDLSDNNIQELPQGILNV